MGVGSGGFWFIRKSFKAILKVLGFLCGVMYGCELCENKHECKDLKGNTVEKQDKSSFLNSEHMRMLRANIRCSFSRKMNILCSFDLATLFCNTCDSNREHVVLRPLNEIKNLASLCPVTFVLADQHFPAILLTTEDGECIKIIRSEDGNLAELANAFLEIIKGFAVPAGSQVLLSSLSQLARWLLRGAP